MAKRKRQPDDFDNPWKEALHHYLPFFLAFFFPTIHADIDWARGYTALDKEFQRIARKAKGGKQLADKLFQVYLLDGSERWLFIHIEIQGTYERRFAQRMSDYNLAARLLYNQTIVSLAALCDDRPNRRPASFSHGHWGCRTETSFGLAKLLDCASDLEALEATDNPSRVVGCSNGCLPR